MDPGFCFSMRIDVCVLVCGCLQHIEGVDKGVKGVPVKEVMKAGVGIFFRIRLGEDGDGGWFSSTSGFRFVGTHFRFERSGFRLNTDRLEMYAKQRLKTGSGIG